MFKALGWYSRNEMLPRLGSIVGSGGLLVSVGIGFSAGRWGWRIVPETTLVSNVAIALLTYSAIALGFSLAGLTLALTLPNDGFLKALCVTKPKEKKRDSYSDLLFVFSWTAVVHWMIVVVSVLLVLFVNPQEPAFSAGKHPIRSGMVAGLVAYGLFQFLVTLITLAQVGSTYIAFLRHSHPTPP